MEYITSDVVSVPTLDELYQPNIEPLLNLLSAWIVELQNDNYASRLAADLLAIQGELVLWQFRQGKGGA